MNNPIVAYLLLMISPDKTLEQKREPAFKFADWVGMLSNTGWLAATAFAALVVQAKSPPESWAYYALPCLYVPLFILAAVLGVSAVMVAGEATTENHYDWGRGLAGLAYIVILAGVMWGLYFLIADLLG